MSFRNRYSSDLSPELQDILRRNGLYAHVMRDAGNGAFFLVVQGHDSPLLRYEISPEQVARLTDWGYDSINKKAYGTLTSIISRDFRLPRAYVNACNAFSSVSMGLHGYTDTLVRRGAPSSLSLLSGAGGYDVLRWQPRSSRMNDYVRSVTVHRDSRPDGYMKPGELESGSFGFYYKGEGESGGTAPADNASRPESVAPGTSEYVDIMEELKGLALEGITVESLQETEALSYREEISSDVYFSKDTFLEVLSSHGITIDEAAHTLVVRTDTPPHVLKADLTPEEYAALTAPALSKDNVAAGQAAASLSSRIGIINGILAADYVHGIDMDLLNSRSRFSAQVLPQAAAEEEAEHIRSEQSAQKAGPEITGEGSVSARQAENIAADRRWTSNRGDSTVIGEVSAARMTDGQYRMTAVLNGQEYTHEITERQFNKFVSLDDYHRMRLVARVFPEAQLRGDNHVLARIAGALLATATVAHEVMHGAMAPDMYMERFGRQSPGPVFFKPGVDTPQDVVSRMFESQKASMEADIHSGRHL